MNQYKHGGDISSFANQFGHDQDTILDLSVNTWPYDVPRGLRKHLIKELGNISYYPDIHSERFRDAVAAHYAVSRDCVVPAGGSIQLVYALCSSPYYDSVVTFEPTFNEYRRASAVYSKKHASLFCLEAKNYGINVNSLIKLSQNNQLIFVCNPNNPTGTLIPNDTLHGILKQSERNDSLLVIDEAFIDFVPDRSVAKWIENYRNLIVLRSLTKYFGLAGLRVGYALTHPDTAERISRYLPPWSLNTLALCAGEWVLNNADHFNRQKDHWLCETRRMMNTAQKHDDLETFPSSTSYFLFQVSSIKMANAFFAFLGQQGIMIRQCDDFIGLDRTYFRVGSRTSEENERFLNSLDAFFLRKPQC